MKERRLNHVIILGCGRSGTSIFGELFEHLSPYTYFSEPPFDKLLRSDFTHPIAVKVPRESTNHPPSAGLSFPLATLLAEIPDPKSIYWQVRHPLDTICSLRVGISQNWGHHPKPPDWQDWLERPLIERCAHHWNHINSVGYEQIRAIARVKHFENMIRKPRQFADAICREINLDIEIIDVALAKWANRVQDTNNEHFVEARTSQNYSRPDHLTRIDRWKENLTREDIKRVIPMLQKTVETFGYSLNSNL
jgi:hypothetical protein